MYFYTFNRNQTASIEIQEWMNVLRRGRQVLSTLARVGALGSSGKLGPFQPMHQRWYDASVKRYRLPLLQYAFASVMLDHIFNSAVLDPRPLNTRVPWYGTKSQVGLAVCIVLFLLGIRL